MKMKQLKSIDEKKCYNIKLIRATFIDEKIVDELKLGNGIKINARP